MSKVWPPRMLAAKFSIDCVGSMTGFVDNPQSPIRGPLRRGRWLQLAVIAAFVAIGLYRSWQQPAQPRNAPPAQNPRPAATADEPGAVQPARAETAEAASEVLRAAPRAAAPAQRPPALPPVATTDQPQATLRTTIPNQKIRDLDGDIAFHGEVDVGSTLARIERGQRLSFPNDGATFENRERRLPRQPPGYYREFVHPTPGLRGPGPQRIVIGRAGETYYTPNHYRTFQRLDQP